MKKEDAEKLVVADPSLGKKLEAHAADAFRQLWDEMAAKEAGSRHVTPSAVRERVLERLKDVLPSGATLPEVRVEINAARTGFDIKILPGTVEPSVLRQVR